MSFVHDDPEFSDLVRIVAERKGLSVGLIEKDYWVTHSLWCLKELGLEVWFKGGTSLSKCFGVIQRFSEDLDIKIEPGEVAELVRVSNWRSEGRAASTERRTFFETLADVIKVPGAEVVLDRESFVQPFKDAQIRVEYPGHYLGELGVLRPYVLLEVGEARVTPCLNRDITSLVHDGLEELGRLQDFEDNRPRGLRCLHPLVTLLEKLDALSRRGPTSVREPAEFVRHFGDAAQIISSAGALPGLPEYKNVRTLAEELLSPAQFGEILYAANPAFQPDENERWNSIRRAHEDIAGMYWGPRNSVERDCAIIRAWIVEAFPESAGVSKAGR